MTLHAAANHSTLGNIVSGTIDKLAMELMFVVFHLTQWNALMIMKA